MKIALLGDIALIGSFDCSCNQNARENLKYIHNLIEDCDFVVGNLEAPLTRNNKTAACKGVYLRSSPENIELLQEMGVTHVTLANNHFFDYDNRGTKETQNILEAAGIQFVGLNTPPKLLKSGEDRALLDGFCCYSANALQYGEKLGKIRILSYSAVSRFLQLAKEMNCCPIVSAHFGEEGLHYPSVEHMKLFRKLSDEGSYVLHGTHPHVLQGYEEYSGSLLFYSLGNLCFDSARTTSIGREYVLSDEQRKTIIVKIKITGNRAAISEIVPIRFDSQGKFCLDMSIPAAVQSYSEALAQQYDSIESIRQKERVELKKQQEKRDVGFFLNRLNVRYIGAFLNGKIHAKAYRRVFSDYMRDRQS